MDCRESKETSPNYIGIPLPGEGSSLLHSPTACCSSEEPRELPESRTRLLCIPFLPVDKTAKNLTEKRKKGKRGYGDMGKVGSGKKGKPKRRDAVRMPNCVLIKLQKALGLFRECPKRSHQRRKEKSGMER